MADPSLTECGEVIAPRGVTRTGIVKQHLHNGRLRVRILDIAEIVRELEVEEVSEGVYQALVQDHKAELNPTGDPQ